MTAHICSCHVEFVVYWGKGGDRAELVVVTIQGAMDLPAAFRPRRCSSRVSLTERRSCRIALMRRRMR